MSNRIRLNYMVNILMLLAFVANLYFTINFNRQIHSATGYILAFLIIIHILLHWQWMVDIMKSIFKMKS